MNKFPMFQSLFPPLPGGYLLMQKEIEAQTSLDKLGVPQKSSDLLNFFKDEIKISEVVRRLKLESFE